ncbi:MAG: hypothetical protein WEB60_01165 [Terrimicrobiaceae bacterium]
MTVSAGSPFWQMALLFFAVVFLLFEAWRGWRAGVVRTAINLLALVVSGVLAVVAGRVVAGFFGGLESPSGLGAALVLGGGLGLVVFFLIWLVGALLFKRTAHHGSGLFRLFWGGGGALVGIVTGLFLLWGGITLIRTLGSLAEGRAETAVKKSQPASPVAKGLVTLKESLELGQAGEFVRSIDVLPTEVYELIVQIARVTSDQEAMLRFIEYPGIQQLMNNQKIADLLADPEVLAAAEKRNFLALMSNKALREAVEDPALAEQLKAIDLREALKQAVAKPTPRPAPTPSQLP